MINKLKVAMISLDLDEFERVLEELDDMDLNTLSADEMNEYADILTAAYEIISAERSEDLKRLQKLSQAKTYTMN